MAEPFGRERRGRSAVWPAWAGPERDAPRPRRVADPWLEPDEPFEGGTVLEDLRVAEDPKDAARILVCYVLVRLILSVVRPPPGFRPDLERAAAGSWLALLPEADPDRAQLTRLVERAGLGVPDSRFAHDVEAAAMSAVARSWWRGAFSLLHSAWHVLGSRGRHADAALLARRLARLAADGGSGAAARRWNQRATAHEKRAAAG